jgi:hypothetical protein
MKRISLPLAVLATAVVGSAGLPVAAAKEPAVTHATAVLAVIGGEIEQPKLVWLNPRTLKRLEHGSVTLEDAHSSVFSPNAAKIAVGSSAFGVRIVDVRRMKLVSKGTARRFGWDINPVFWPTQRRLLALEWHQRLPSTRLVVIDPVARRVVKRTPLDPPLLCWEVAGRELVAVATPAEGIGPARLVVVDPDGAMRSVSLDRIPAGGRTEGTEEDPTYRLASPGLAVDPVARRAYVVGQAPLLAEIDLDSLTVTYRELVSSRSLAARTKVVTGWTRQATWLGDGRIAVTGAEYDGLRSTPSGLLVIDARFGTSRLLEPRASMAVVSQDVILAAGTARDGQTDEESGMGIGAFSADGELLWHALGTQPVWWAQTAGGYAYVIGPESYPPTVRVIDLATGAVRTVRGAMPFFVTG